MEQNLYLHVHAPILSVLFLWFTKFNSVQLAHWSNFEYHVAIWLVEALSRGSQPRYS